MFFWWIRGGESVLPILLLRHLSSSPILSKTLIHFSVVGLCSLLGSCWTWGDPVLGSMSSMVGLMVTSKRVLCQGGPSRTAATSGEHLNPCGEPLLTHASTAGPSTIAGCFGSVSCGVTAPFFWVLVQARFCFCPPRLESLFSPVLWKSYNQILLVFKVRFPGDPQSLCWIPRLGSLIWCSEPSQRWENFFGIMFSSLWVTHLVGMGFDFIMTVSFLPSCCSFFVFGHRVSFFVEVRHPPVDGCSTAICSFGVLEGGDEHTSFYPTILNQKPITFFLKRKRLIKIQVYLFLKFGKNLGSNEPVNTEKFPFTL